VPESFSIAVQLHSFKSGTANPSNLVPITCQTKIAVGTKSKNVRLALPLNIHSLKNKSLLVNDLITTYNLDFIFLNDTWFEDSCSGTFLNETSPPAFTFMSVRKVGKRGGGLAALFKDVYEYKQMSFGNYPSFEYLGIVLKGVSSILLIYRPSKYSPAFAEDFTELLSTISSEFDCFATFGDFNIHIHNGENNMAKEIKTVLKPFDLTQHIHGPTHNCGHTLDLLISKGLNFPSIVIKDVAVTVIVCTSLSLVSLHYP